MSEWMIWPTQVDFVVLEQNGDLHDFPNIHPSQGVCLVLGSRLRPVTALDLDILRIAALFRWANRWWMSDSGRRRFDLVATMAVEQSSKEFVAVTLRWYSDFPSLFPDMTSMPFFTKVAPSFAKWASIP
jgi:hypothetical protein